MRDDTDFLIKIDGLLARYIQEVDQSNLKRLSAQTYRVQAINFVRWIKKDFKPGNRKHRDI